MRIYIESLIIILITTIGICRSCWFPPKVKYVPLSGPSFPPGCKPGTPGCLFPQLSQSGRRNRRSEETSADFHVRPRGNVQDVKRDDSDKLWASGQPDKLADRNNNLTPSTSLPTRHGILPIGSK